MIYQSEQIARQTCISNKSVKIVLVSDITLQQINIFFNQGYDLEMDDLQNLLEVTHKKDDHGQVPSHGNL